MARMVWMRASWATSSASSGSSRMDNANLKAVGWQDLTSFSTACELPFLDWWTSSTRLRSFIYTIRRDSALIYEVLIGSWRFLIIIILFFRNYQGIFLHPYIDGQVQKIEFY